MQKAFSNNKQTLHYIVTIVVVLLVVFLDPKNATWNSFSQHIEKTFYQNSCDPRKHASSTDPSFLKVLEVVDGDTIEVSEGCKTTKVRLIGINTPESVDPRRPVQCYGLEASHYAKELLNGALVRLQTDPVSETLDKYGRTLAYVIMENGTNVNLLMIQQGFAQEYTYKSQSYLYQKEFKTAQIKAKTEGKGLWNINTCNGKN